MTKQFKWNNYIVQITKKKIKRTNLRIKPDNPNTIHMSIPYQMSYGAAMQVLEQPKILQWIENYEKKAAANPPEKTDWYEKHKKQESAYRARLQEILPTIIPAAVNIVI